MLQTAYVTRQKMVFDLSDRTVYWCENRRWDRIEKRQLHSVRPGAC